MRSSHHRSGCSAAVLCTLVGLASEYCCGSSLLTTETDEAQCCQTRADSHSGFRQAALTQQCEVLKFANIQQLQCNEALALARGLPIAAVFSQPFDKKSSASRPHWQQAAGSSEALVGAALPCDWDALCDAALVLCIHRQHLSCGPASRHHMNRAVLGLSSTGGNVGSCWE